MEHLGDLSDKITNKGILRRFERSTPLLFECGGNAMCTVWTMPTSWEPPMMVSAVAPTRHTFSLVEVGAEIRIGLPDSTRLDEIIKTFGRKSGADFQKPPMDGGCICILSGFVVRLLPTGDHILILSEITDMDKDFT